MRGRVVSMLGVGGLLVAAACSSPYADSGGRSEQGATLAPPARATSPTDPNPLPPTPAPAPTPHPVPESDGGGGTSGPDGGADAAATDPTHCPSKGTPTVAAWRAAPSASSVCSAADITYFAGIAASQTWLGIQSLMTTRNANCSKCIFSKDTDAAWRPVVFSGTQGDAIVNYSACFARAPGGSNACGTAVYQWSDCYAKACDSAACGTQAALDACYARQDVSAACAAFVPTTPCGGTTAYNALNNICNTYVDVSRVLCSSGN